MKAAAALLLTLLLDPASALLVKNEDAAFAVNATAATGEDAGPCDEQCRFDILMCNSFMCTECTYDWCTSACQQIQKDFPSSRCEKWPASRKTFSDTAVAAVPVVAAVADS